MAKLSYEEQWGHKPFWDDIDDFNERVRQMEADI